MSAAVTRLCRHCSTAFDPQDTGDEFCCGGCAFVHQLIHDSGFDQYYRLKAGKPIAPVKSTAFQQRDGSWIHLLAAAARDAAGAGRAAELDLAVQGISCAGCVWLIEKIALRTPGVLRARVRAHPGRLHLEWSPADCDPAALADELRRFGYLVGPLGSRDRTGSEFSARTGLCGAFAMNAMAFSLPRYLGMEAAFPLARIFTLVAGLSAALAVCVGGSYFIIRAWRCLRSGVLHMDLPIAVGILAAFAGSILGWMIDAESLLYFDFVAVFTFLMLAGRQLQLAAVERNRGRLLGPSSENVPMRNAKGDAVPLENLAAGMEFLASPGGVVPVASLVCGDGGEISTEAINGEPEPRLCRAGERIPAGSLNIGRVPLHLQAMETWQESLYRRLRESSESEALHPALDAILRVAIRAVLSLAAAGFIGWWVFTGDIARALQVFISVLVVSCPCALGVALPLADDLSAGRMERCGVFIRRPVFWARLRRVRKVIFDKTGTLTLESPALENPGELEVLRPEALRALATLVSGSLHPLCRSLTEQLAGMKALVSEPAAEVHEEAGNGVWFVCPRGARWSLGRPGWDSPRETPGTVFACDGVALARFRFRDALRPDAASQISEMQASGVEVHLLSGDLPEKVSAMACLLDIPPQRARGGLSPTEKAAIVSGLDDGDTLYIGDGINDTLAFSEAACTGTPVVDKGMLESKADFYFLSRSFRFFSVLRAVAQRRAAAVRRVVAFAVVYNIAAAGFSLAGLMNPLLAAVIMPLSGLCTLAIVALHFRPGSR